MRGGPETGIRPPFSQKIEALEGRVGAPFLLRLAHGAELVPALEAFLDVVKEMSGLADKATKAARRAARPVSCA